MWRTGGETGLYTVDGGVKGQGRSAAGGSFPHGLGWEQKMIEEIGEVPWNTTVATARCIVDFHAANEPESSTPRRLLPPAAGDDIISPLEAGEEATRT
jgi:hypothetical protein